MAGDAITLPEYFKNRFHDESGWISVVSAVFILVFFLFYTASGFVSCAKLFSSVFGIPYLVSLTVGAVVVISVYVRRRLLRRVLDRLSSRVS